MADITMCNDVHCPMREDCYRFKAKPNWQGQSYFGVTPRNRLAKSECREFIPAVAHVQKGGTQDE